MSLQGRADPDPHDEPGHDGAGEPGPAPADKVSGPGDLTLKPVLDWTDDDWSRWIDGPDPGRLPPAPVERMPADLRDEPPEAELWAPLGGDEPWADVATEAAREAPPEAEPVDSGEPADPEPSSGGTDPVVAATAPGGDEEPGDADDWAGVADHPWWNSAPVDDEERAPDPEPAASVDVPAPASPLDPQPPPPVDQATAPPLDAEPSRVPVEPAAAAPLVPVPSRVRIEPAPAGPSTRPEPTGAIEQRETMPRPSPRSTRALPAAPSGREGAGWTLPGTPDTSHRVRSAFGLVAMAVVVGAVMAGLITVAIFAIALALRHAAG